MQNPLPTAQEESLGEVCLGFHLCPHRLPPPPKFTPSFPKGTKENSRSLILSLPASKDLKCPGLPASSPGGAAIQLPSRPHPVAVTGGWSEGDAAL